MSNLPVDAVLVALVAIIVQLLKPYLELWLKADAPEHDPTIRAVAVVLAIGLRLLEAGMPVDGPAVIALLGYGLGTALAAIGTYHILSPALGNPVPPVVLAPPRQSQVVLDVPPRPPTSPAGA